jgi:hypothetical protein
MKEPDWVIGYCGRKNIMKIENVALKIGENF